MPRSTAAAAVTQAASHKPAISRALAKKLQRAKRLVGQCQTEVSMLQMRLFFLRGRGAQRIKFCSKRLDV